MASNTGLNLARKWRPQYFDDIVGQDIPIRILKNSLFKSKFFPVYLFAGQRGCGKTSTARVFGTAVNCSALSIFQNDPSKQALPCLTCESCQAMMQGHHPDFIEIDAASHTGVDNVRQIIDSSSYMPLLGNKKIYLIDEAHMLSKAAFNAFLKILEEPPASVLFILATTEIPKIPPTVLSRCFQVIFTSLNHQALKDHLVNICKQEEISIDDQALDILLAETEGSARDAINLLERVRFSQEHITEQTILAVLGKISNTELFTLFQTILDQNPGKILENLSVMNFEQQAAQALWDLIVHLCRAVLWTKYGVSTPPPPFQHNYSMLITYSKKCSFARLHAMLQLLWTQEELFLKTNKKHAFLELVLLQLCEQVNTTDLQELIIQAHQLGPIEQTDTQNPLRSIQSAPIINTKITNNSENQPSNLPPKQVPETPTLTSTCENPAWGSFIAQIITTKDPLLVSIFQQARFISYNQEINNLTIQLNNNSKFFRDKLEESKEQWLPLLQSNYQNPPNLLFQEAQQGTNEEKSPSLSTNSSTLVQTVTPIIRKTTGPSQPQKSQIPSKEIFSPSQWPKATLIASHFPGKIKRSE